MAYALSLVASFAYPLCLIPYPPPLLLLLFSIFPLALSPFSALAVRFRSKDILRKSKDLLLPRINNIINWAWHPPPPPLHLYLFLSLSHSSCSSPECPQCWQHKQWVRQRPHVSWMPRSRKAARTRVGVPFSSCLLLATPPNYSYINTHPQYPSLHASAKLLLEIISY